MLQTLEGNLVILNRVRKKTIKEISLQCFIPLKRIGRENINCKRKGGVVAYTLQSSLIDKEQIS